jgi:3-(3-hydroxy-phenyl)propionate hydroxylase
MDGAPRAFAYRASPEQRATLPAFHPVVVVGAGPVGLSLAIDLAQRGVPVLLLDADDRLATGSRAICFAKRTLEIFDRLGCGEPMVARGVSWNVGHVYFGDEEVYRFDLLPEPGHERPAFINLQQYHVEAFLVQRAQALAGLEIRWRNTVTGIDGGPGGAVLHVDTPDGPYRVRAGHVCACDGARSTLRARLGLDVAGQAFHDRYLIADVRIEGLELPAERRFWFDPPFHPGRSVLLHKQADGVWRIDFQLGRDADPHAERQPGRVLPRVRAVLERVGVAEPAAVDLVWASVYGFACQRLPRFRHGRVLFAGDAAHGMSPFGARGANSGVQDADNLAWKLARVVRGEAPAALLDSYAHEREAAADENLRHSRRTAEFIGPGSEASRRYRDAVLQLARLHSFARRLVNSGRLSAPGSYPDSPLGTPDVDPFAGGLPPGTAAADAPLVRGDSPAWLLRELGDDFALVVFGPAPPWAAELPLRTVAIDGASLADAEGWATRRYGAQPGNAYLLRPDRHVAARWREPTPAAVRAAWRRAHALA